MFALLKELADRFIEFVLILSKGENTETRLTSALKSSIYLISVLGCIIASLIVTNINQRIRLDDTESGVRRVNELFDTTSGGPINGFLRANETLVNQNVAIKRENVLLLKAVITLGEQNKWTRLQVAQLIDENRTLKENNSTIRQMCVVNK